MSNNDNSFYHYCSVSAAELANQSALSSGAKKKEAGFWFQLGSSGQEEAGCVDLSMARNHVLLSLGQDGDSGKTLFKDI